MIDDRNLTFSQRFCAAEQVVSSPLSRAVQTAVLALAGHPALKHNDLLLMRSARELKNFGGMDCVGTHTGAELWPVIQDKLALTIGPEQAAAACAGVRVDPGDTWAEWWTKTGDMDTESIIAGRFFDFWATLRYSPHQRVIVAGHSAFFRLLCDQHIPVGGELELANPGLVKKLRAHKLTNASCLAIEVDFRPRCFPEIVRAELLFGSDFKTS